MLVDLVVVLFNVTVNVLLDLLYFVSTTCLFGLRFHRVSLHFQTGFPLLFFYFSFNALLFVQVTLQQSVIQIDLGQ